MNKNGLEALIQCLKFLDDLNVQLLDHAHSDEEVKESMKRCGLLVPIIIGPKSMAKRTAKVHREVARTMRKDQSDRVNMARAVIQELIRDFGKSDNVARDQIEL